MKNSTHGEMENDLWFPECRGQLGCLTRREEEEEEERGGW